MLYYCYYYLVVGDLVTKFYLLNKISPTYILTLVKPLPLTEMTELPEMPDLDEFFTVYTKLAEMALLASKDLTTAKKKVTSSRV